MFFLSFCHLKMKIPINVWIIKQAQLENQTDGVSRYDIYGNSEEMRHLQMLLHHMELKNTALEEKVSRLCAVYRLFSHVKQQLVYFIKTVGQSKLK